MSSHRLALPALILASLIGSTIGVAIKFILLELGPFTTLFLRFLVASLLIIPLTLTTKFTITRSFLKSALVLSIFFAANVTLFITGIKFTTAIAAGILYTTNPLLVALATKIRRKHEPINFNQFLGLTLSLLGVVIIFLRSFDSSQETLSSLGTPIGNMLMLIATFSYSIYLYMSQPLTRVYPPLALTAVNLVVTTSIAFLLTIWEFSHHQAIINPITTITPALILYLAIIATIGMYLLYQWGIKYSSSFTAATTFYIGPLATAVLAIPLLGERLTPHLLFGGAAILIGVYLAQPKITLPRERTRLPKRPNRQSAVSRVSFTGA